jgi:hypothetical protein
MGPGAFRHLTRVGTITLPLVGAIVLTRLGAIPRGVSVRTYVVSGFSRTGVALSRV